jgi:hypothetical protein
MAEDKDGKMWIGTRTGIAIVNCVDNIFSANGCNAQIPIVKFDNYAGYLFQNEIVRTIAVDGANRKWIGTDNGIWLLNDVGDKIINRFEANNSPLPSNEVKKIVIDPKTGIVYISTNNGLVSYRGSAIDGGETNEELVIFPHPITPNYDGPIAIKGFVNNADVKITDINGMLVYQTKALGGQVVWDGKNYLGKKPQSGVYLIFATDALGTQKAVGKMLMVK